MTKTEGQSTGAHKLDRVRDATVVSILLNLKIKNILIKFNNTLQNFFIYKIRMIDVGGFATDGLLQLEPSGVQET